MSVQSIEAYPREAPLCLRSASPDPRGYVEPGAEADARAVYHGREARDALATGQAPNVAVTHALLAIEARIDELTWHVARLG